MARHKNKSPQGPQVSPDTDHVSQGGVEPAAGLPVSGVLSKPELARALDAFEHPEGLVGDPVETPSLFRTAPPAADQVPQKSADPLDGLDIQGLLALRARIGTKLPPLSIAEMNLEEELVIQYYSAKALVAAVAGDDLVPTNQKAQVQNSCAAILKTLADVKVAVFSAERVQAIQLALEKAFQGESEEVKKRFFERYARLVRDFTAQKDSKIQQFAPVLAKT